MTTTNEARQALLDAGYREGANFRVLTSGLFAMDATNPRNPQLFMTPAEVLTWLEASR